MDRYREKVMYFNKPQQRSILTMCKEEFDVWGRGTGKTQGPLAYRTIQAANAMPRGATGLVGLTYMQLLDRTLPPLMKAWENFGYYEGLHYWVRRRPPKEYKIPDAIYPVLHPEHTIFWWNGHAFHLISQDRPGSANGKTVDAIAGDEVRFLNHKRYMDDIAPINRGNREIFGSRPEHHMVTMCTDMPTDPKAKWILDKKDLMDTKKIAQIVNFQLEVQRLEQQFYLAETTESKRYYRRKRNEYVRVLNALRANTVYYSEASSLDNLEILGVDTIKQWRREMLWPVFRAAILNENVIAVTNGFYHLLDTDHHCYSLYDYSYIESMGLYLPEGLVKDCRNDGDLIKGMPIDISFDYNSSIKSLVIGQETERFYRVLKSMYVKREQEKVLDDLVDDFCKYYKHHNNHTVNYFYDNTANVTDATRLETLSDMVTARLIKNDWAVNRFDIGQQPMHETRFRLFEAVFKENDSKFKPVRFNRENCDALLTSMQQVQTRSGKNGTEKDKRPESNSSVKQEEAPHLSDAFDTLYIGKFKTQYGYVEQVGDLIIG
ncbi:hypothetical protein [Sphingobacterium multivorum]|uniref:hypothetical protein n=1 Tax=Sphingobacterium multivorum TaxID=28454 RepID=UPI00369C1AB8